MIMISKKYKDHLIIKICCWSAGNNMQWGNTLIHSFLFSLPNSILILKPFLLNSPTPPIQNTHPRAGSEKWEPCMLQEGCILESRWTFITSTAPHTYFLLPSLPALLYGSESVFIHFMVQGTFSFFSSVYETFIHALDRLSVHNPLDDVMIKLTLTRIK